MSLGYPLPSPDPHPAVESVIHGILQATHNSKKKWYVSSPTQASPKIFVTIPVVPSSVLRESKLQIELLKDLIWSVVAFYLSPRADGQWASDQCYFRCGGNVRSYRKAFGNSQWHMTGCTLYYVPMNTKENNIACLYAETEI